MKDLLCKYDSRQWPRDSSFHLTDIKFKIGAEIKCWTHAVAWIDCQRKGENVMWKSKLQYDILMMVGDIRWFSKFISEMMNSKLYITLLPLIRCLAFPYVLWEQQYYPKHPNWWYPNKLCMAYNRPTIVLCF